MHHGVSPSDRLPVRLQLLISTDIELALGHFVKTQWGTRFAQRYEVGSGLCYT
jgi:hypothetical protein